MEDPPVIADRLRREEEMERLLRQQEEELNEEDPAVAAMNPENRLNQQQQEDDAAGPIDDNIIPAGPASSHNTPKRLSYTTLSFTAALATLYYALRTREQWYLALTYLSTSKWASCVLANAVVATAVQIFSTTTHVCLNGLRLQEAEGLQDYLRWNVTETCLALTMFRNELTVWTAGQFLGLVLAKCLHEVALLREQHWRMSEDAIVAYSAQRPWLPWMPWRHLKLVWMLGLLQLGDLMALEIFVVDLVERGPSVSILFAFEAAILLVSAWSHLLLWQLHVLDGTLHLAHDNGFGSRALHWWKEYKATLVFAVELQSQAVQFLFYLTFFGIVMTYYGVPINLFREVYVTWIALQERVGAFLRYRRLMAHLTNYPNATPQALEDRGSICIICRDTMTCHDAKELPGCQHLFHKSCLREWLVQQQTCPTCRADLARAEAQEVARERAEERREANETDADTNQAGEEAKEEAASPADESQSTTTRGVPDVAPESMDRMPRRVSFADDGPAETTNGPSPSDQPLSYETPESSRNTARYPRVWFSPDTPDSGDRSDFPALYKVKTQFGASVLSALREPISVERIIPYDTVVICKRRKFRVVDEQNVPMLRIPDGWIAEQSVQRVISLQSALEEEER